MASTNATSYEIWRYTSTWQLIGTTAGASYIDNDVLPETTYQYYLIAINPAGSSSPSASITVKTPPSIWIDLDIDSFNTSRFAAPSRTQAEDDIEDDPDHFGKIIYPNYGDINDNGILDIWDGYNYGSQFNSGTNCSEHFVPIVLEIPQGINLANATFQFDYWLGSPTMTGYSPASPPRFGDGNIRIWTKDGDQPRSANSIHLGGNLIMDGMSYTAQQLGFADTNRTITLYIEGHMLSSTLGNREIIVSMDCVYNGENVHVEDRVKYTVAGFGFTPYTPETEYITSMPIPDVNWKENGVGIRRNGDYDDGKSSPDWIYGTASAKENDLIQLTIDVTPLSGIEYRLKAVSSNPDVRLWESKLKGGYPLATYTDTGYLLSASKTVYAEYVSAGDTQETFVLSAISTATGQELFFEEIVFRPFYSVTMAFVGEFEQAGDPNQSPGINDWVIQELLNGYDVHVWDDGHDVFSGIEDCNKWGEGRAFDEVTNAINNRGVTKVALLGYSHGGGSVYNLAWRMFYDGGTSDSNLYWYPPKMIYNRYDLVFTSYIDAVPNNFWAHGLLGASVTQRPKGSSYHLNQFQENTIPNGCSISTLLTSDDEEAWTSKGLKHSDSNFLISIDTNPEVQELLTQKYQEHVSR